MSIERQSVDALLAERATTHGEYADHAQLTQDTLDLWTKSPNWDALPAIIKETLHMTAHKVGRVLTGNPFLRDHYDDVAGYNRLVSQRINADQTGLADEYVRPRPAPRTVPGEPQPVAERPGLVLTPDDVGKVFRTRDGRRVQLDNAHHSDTYPYHGVMIENNYDVSFTTRGTVYNTMEHALDLVERLQDSGPFVLTKADVGKKFRRRDGKFATITNEDGHHTYPFDVECVEDGGAYSVTRKGFLISTEEEYPNDLVARVEESLKLTPSDVGKRFRTRDGSIATIIDHHKHKGLYPFDMRVGDREPMQIAESGMYWNPGPQHGLDLVARVD